jgi:hypothetical protein
VLSNSRVEPSGDHTGSQSFGPTVLVSWNQPGTVHIDHPDVMVVHGRGGAAERHPPAIGEMSGKNGVPAERGQAALGTAAGSSMSQISQHAAAVAAERDERAARTDVRTGVERVGW